MSGAMTEFKIISDLNALRQQVIEANFEEVRGWLDENLAPYRAIAVTADDLPAAKTYRANIRKVRDRIDQSRKEAKAAALEAYTAFEVKCKELTGLCDEAANAIDAQVKAIEDAEKREKIEKLHAEYIAATDDEMELYCPWERVYNEKWGNKGYRYDDAVEEIQAALYLSRHDLISIREIGGNDTPYLLDIYKQTHDLNAVIRKSRELKELREREEAQRRKEAERAAQEAERQKQLNAIASSAPVADPAPAIDEKTEEAMPEIVDRRTFTVTFRVYATREQLADLSDFLKKNNIRYERA